MITTNKYALFHLFIKLIFGKYIKSRLKNTGSFQLYVEKTDLNSEMCDGQIPNTYEFSNGVIGLGQRCLWQESFGNYQRDLFLKYIQKNVFGQHLRFPMQDID